MLKAEHSTFSSGIGFDRNENIIVETVITIVQRFSSQGEHLDTFSSFGNLDYQLRGPHGLSADNEGNIIADTFNKQLTN